MEENIKEKQPYFTLKRKGIASLICLAAAVLWLILWNIFPMPFYSLFFASNIGSNIILVLLAAMLTFPLNFLFSKTLGTDISVPAMLIVNIVCMMAFIYLYSIFRYTAVWWVIIAAVVHMAAAAVVFAKSRQPKIPKLKTEKKTLKLAVCGIVSALLSDSLYLLLFTALLNIFRE